MTTFQSHHERRGLVLDAVPFDDALTATEVAMRAFGPSGAWRQRQNVRNDLVALCDRGAVICDEERPMRFLRPDPTLQEAQA